MCTSVNRAIGLNQVRRWHTDYFEQLGSFAVGVCWYQRNPEAYRVGSPDPSSIGLSTLIATISKP